MKTSDMFPRKYATGADFGGKAVTLTIERMQPEQMRPGPNAPTTTKYVLYFKEAQKGVILNRTLSDQIETITGSDDTDDWPGCRVTLYPVPMQVAGTPRIAIRAREPAANNGHGAPPETLQDPDNDGEGED